MNMEKWVPEKTPYIDTFLTLIANAKLGQVYIWLIQAVYIKVAYMYIYRFFVSAYVYA